MAVTSDSYFYSSAVFWRKLIISDFLNDANRRASLLPNECFCYCVNVGFKILIIDIGSDNK